MTNRVSRIKPADARAIRNELARRLYDGELAGLPVIGDRPVSLEGVALVIGVSEPSSASRAVASARLRNAPAAASVP